MDCHQIDVLVLNIFLVSKMNLRPIEAPVNIGWIQTSIQERVKGQSVGNLTSSSKSPSKIRPACEILVIECMRKCLFYQKLFSIILMGKLPHKLANLKTFWIRAILTSALKRPNIRQFSSKSQDSSVFRCWNLALLKMRNHGLF